MGVFFWQLGAGWTQTYLPGSLAGVWFIRSRVFKSAQNKSNSSFDKKNQPQQRLECSRAIKISPFLAVQTIFLPRFNFKLGLS